MELAILMFFGAPLALTAFLVWREQKNAPQVPPPPPRQPLPRWDEAADKKALEEERAALERANLVHRIAKRVDGQSDDEDAVRCHPDDYSARIEVPWRGNDRHWAFSFKATGLGEFTSLSWELGDGYDPEDISIDSAVIAGSAPDRLRKVLARPVIEQGLIKLKDTGRLVSVSVDNEGRLEVVLKSDSGSADEGLSDFALVLNLAHACDNVAAELHDERGLGSYDLSSTATEGTPVAVPLKFD